MSRTMKDSGIPWIGEIPSHWKLMPHKWVMHKEKEIREKYHGETILSLTMKGVIVRDLDAGGKMPSSFDGYQAVYPNDLLQCLFDIDVTPRCVGLVKNEGLVSPAYSRFVLYSNGYTPYYDYLLRYMDDNKVLLHLSKNLRSSLTETDFGAINTCVPPLPEQQSIADFLDKKCVEIDEMISLQEKIVEELKAYKQSVITEAVCKGLNPNVPMKDSGIEWIGQIPEGWSIDKIVRSFDLIGSGTTPKSTDDTNFEGDICWIQSGDINGSYLTSCKNKISNNTLERFSALKVYPAPFIIVAMYGASVGNASISQINGCVNQACCVLKGNRLNLNYAFAAIKACKDYLIRKAVGGGQPNISQDTIKSTWIPVPPEKEQQAIADYLERKCNEIDTLISLKQSKIDALKEYKKSIIYEYITGKKEI